MKLSTRAASVAALALCATAVAAPVTSAAPASDCPGVAVSQAFSAWGDKSFYADVPGGSFEQRAAAWDLGGAKLVADDGPLTAGSRALEVGASKAATSPVFCAGKGFPTARTFARGSGEVAVDVLHVDAAGRLLATKRATTIVPGAAWAPSNQFSMSQGQTNKYGPLVRFRLTGLRGTVRIDDVLVDPRLSR